MSDVDDLRHQVKGILTRENNYYLDDIQEVPEQAYSIIDIESFSMSTLSCAEIENNEPSPSCRSARQIDLRQTSDFFVTLQVTHENFWEAIEMGDKAEVNIFLEIPNLDVNLKGLNDWTALHIASARGFKGIVKILLDHGSKVHAKTSMNRTALHLACMHNHKKVVQVLVDHGCDLNIQDNDENSALHYASSLGYLDIVEYLLKHSCNIKLKNNLNRTPADLSLNLETFQLFKSKIWDEEYKTSYSRTTFGQSLRHNSREDHVNQILFKSKTGHKESDYKVFKNRPKLKSIRASVPIYKVGYQDFSVILQLGRGSFGCVYLVEKKNSKERFALKVLDKAKMFSFNMEKYALSERNILTKLDSPFIVKLHYSFQTREKLALVLDYCPHGDLAISLKKDKRFSEELTRFYACEILLGLDALHKKGIIFRDLKPDNVLIDHTGHIKLTDFGLSKELDFDTLAVSFCGSPLYLAPEMLGKKGHTKSIDFYVFGVIIYEMLHGYTPFFSHDKDALFKNIKNGKLSFEDYVSNQAKDLIKKLLERNPKKRLGDKGGAEEIKDHPFFIDVNWTDVALLNVRPPPVRPIPRIERSVPLEIVYGDLEEDVETPRIDNWSILHHSI